MAKKLTLKQLLKKVGKLILIMERAQKHETTSPISYKEGK